MVGKRNKKRRARDNPTGKVSQRLKVNSTMHVILFRSRKDVEGPSFNLDAEQNSLGISGRARGALNYLIPIRDGCLRRASVLQRRGRRTSRSVLSRTVDRIIVN